MTKELNFNCAATMIGSVPYTDPEAACTIISKYLKDWPAWPQLPMRSNLENMYVQFCEGFPGIRVNGQNLSFEHDTDTDRHIERIFSDSVEDNFSSYSISGDYASGLDYYIEKTGLHLPAIKGQVTGPISWGLCVTDHEGRGIIYDEMLAETAARFLRLKASWQETALRRQARDTIIFVDEPYLTSLGSAFIALSNDQVALLITEVLRGIRGIRGLHCCGGTDWSLLLGLPLDIISFDTYNYLDSFVCHPAAINSFLDRGGVIAWGIVPNDEETLKKESQGQLYDRLCEAINLLVRPTFNFKDIVRRSLVTPSCGLASLSTESAEYAFNLLGELSQRVQRKYSG